ncbi:MAG: spore coat protein [Acetivibrio sp.]
MLLTQKETMLLKDLKAQEELCIKKYAKYSAGACDGELKNLFSQIGKTEQQHFNTVSQILGENTGQNKSGDCACKEAAATVGEQEDKYLCEDALASEKLVSSVYNTSIFEFKEVSVREALNHIQKEEQQHGEQIYSYMAAHGMYATN